MLVHRTPREVNAVHPKKNDPSNGCES